MKINILSWNINSLRLRLPLLKNVLEQAQADIVCLQETKVDDQAFPLEAVKALGFEYICFNGMKGQSGTAILSRIPCVQETTQLWCNKDDKRHTFVRLHNGIEIHNYYVPAGGDEPDVMINPKFAHKLQFLTEQATWWQERRHSNLKAILVGDLNIAPLACDVWSHKQLLQVVSHTEIEIKHLKAWQQSCDWVDIVRKHHQPPQKVYTWWSYRAKDWRKSDRGRRLDHIWTTPNLQESCETTQIFSQFRDGDKPSDHVPLVARFSL